MVVPPVFLYCCLFSRANNLRQCKRMLNRPKTYRKLVGFSVLTALLMAVSIAFAINGTR